MYFSRRRFLLTFLIRSLVTYLISLRMWFKLYPVLFSPNTLFYKDENIINWDYKKKNSMFIKVLLLPFIYWKCITESFKNTFRT